MPLITSASPCEVSDEVCCEVMFGIAEHLLESVSSALSPCYEDSECGGMPTTYVTFGQGDDGVRDALTVAILSAAPSPSTLTGKGGTTMPLGLYRTLYEVRLRESGWPMAESSGGEILVPNPVTQMQAARQSFSHGEMMYRKLHSMLATRTLVPSTFPVVTNAIIGPMLPLQPLGGVVGFFAQITIDMPWNWSS